MAASQHIRRFLEEIGQLDDGESQVRRAPDKFTSMVEAMTSGSRNPAPTVDLIEHTGRKSTGSNSIAITDISFYSLCPHHLVPMFGAVDIGYVPQDHIVGFGAFHRIVDHFASKLQLQETLIDDIADYLSNELAPSGLVVQCRARQMCVELTCADQPSHFTTRTVRGNLDPSAVNDRFDLPGRVRTSQ